MRRPRPLPGHNPGDREQPTSNMRRPAREPKIVAAAHYVEHEAGHLKKVGMNAAKSAGHAAHDILHGIGL